MSEYDFEYHLKNGQRYGVRSNCWFKIDPDGTEREDGGLLGREVALLNEYKRLREALEDIMDRCENVNCVPSVPFNIAEIALRLDEDWQPQCYICHRNMVLEDGCEWPEDKSLVYCQRCASWEILKLREIEKQTVTWTCGCGIVNGVNLSVCRVCGRHELQSCTVEATTAVLSPSASSSTPTRIPAPPRPRARK